MRGSIVRRGRRSWRIKFDLDRERDGKRQIKYITVRGTRKEAEAELARLLAAADGGTLVEPSKQTVAEFVRARVTAWEASGSISARTAQRYRQLVENQIVPHLGAKAVQKLKPLDVEGWHTTLRNSGKVRGEGALALHSIRGAHRVLGKAMRDAMRNGMVARNVVSEQAAPKIADDEMMIVRDVPSLVDRLRDWQLGTVAMVSLFTGMRLSEILALRWSRVDLATKVIQVREALEQTKAHGIRFKLPKSKAGRRDITLPDALIDVLREHRKAALQLRHTHASQLIDEGVDIVTISKRLGHAKPDITLRVYAHLFRKDDGKAAAAINAIWKR